MSLGWIKLHRQIIDSKVFANAELLKTWIYILSRASHSDVIYEDMNGVIVKLEPGQLATGRLSMSSDLKITPSKADRHIKKLKSERMIEQLATGRGSIITVLNWSIYQESNSQRTADEQPANSPRTTSEQPANTYKNVNNENNGENVKKETIGEDPEPLKPTRPKYNTRASKEKALENEFQFFWSNTRFPKRRQDAKAGMKRKWMKLVLDDGLTIEQIYDGANCFADAEAGNDFAIGMRKFLEKDTVLQYLEGDVVKERSRPRGVREQRVQKNRETIAKMISDIDNEADSQDQNILGEKADG